MCAPKSFKGLKCLLCAFWSKKIAGKEEEDWVDYKYFTERYKKEQKCLSEVFDYYGVELIVKTDYKSCIKELETGLYYSCWVICGDGSGRLPNGGNANLVGQFIECVIKFWMGGGALVWWCDNEPLTYEANLFLEKVEFPGEVTKTSVRFSGNHRGMQTMIQGNIKEKQISVFNNQRKFVFGKYERFSLGHNLVKMYMGYTVSYIEKSVDIKPFIPFGYDEEGGLSIIFYPSNIDFPHGDIIIDGGFTKLLYELETEGTERYILNIISWTTQYSRRYDESKVENRTEIQLFPKFDFNIDESVKWEGFIERKSPDFDIVYMIDATGSMSDYIKSVKEQCINISNILKKKYPHLSFNFGAIFYRDPIDSPSDKHDLIQLTNEMNDFQKKVGEIKAYGGGDEPEDWVGAYKMVIYSIAWRSGTRLIIHIADAPAHGEMFCGKKNHNNEEPKLLPLIQNIARKNIKIYAFQINSTPALSFTKCREFYNTSGGLMYTIKDYSSIKQQEIISRFKDLIVDAVTCAAPRDL